ncbi:hypothetical protein DRO69_06530 [Candidatus Bathyarchaeota archaeon]|nr:MAG: hypothetical protein DRO69_06530 [Candidatus Bathyarchaeota archaeon]
MVLEKETKIFQSRNARTQYIMISADIVNDSQYPFKEGEKVRITVDPYRRMMIIRSVKEPYIEVSREGIYIKGKQIEVVEE